MDTLLGSQRQEFGGSVGIQAPTFAEKTCFRLKWSIRRGQRLCSLNFGVGITITRGCSSFNERFGILDATLTGRQSVSKRRGPGI